MGRAAQTQKAYFAAVQAKSKPKCFSSTGDSVSLRLLVARVGRFQKLTRKIKKGIHKGTKSNQGHGQTKASAILHRQMPDVFSETFAL